MKTGCLLLIWLAWPAPAAEPGRVVVVCRSGAEAYDQALAATRGQLGESAVVLDLAGKQPSDLAAALAGARAVVAIGDEALRRLEGRRLELPVVSSMLMRYQASAIHIDAPHRTDVVLDAPLERVLQELGRVLPQGGRLGIIHNPTQPLDRAALASAARHRGLTLVFAECRRPADLLSVLRDLKSRADMVLCLPDAALYNSATVPRLIMASLELRLPLIGFSPAFVKAGAALGIYPDFAEMGRQAAELARGGEAAPESVVGPRKLTTAANLRVLRLLGMPQPASRELVVYR